MWQAFRGRERLAVVFWMYCVVGVTVAVVLPFLIAEPLYDRGFPLWFFTLLAVAQSVYLLWAHLSLWTCAFNSSKRLWGYVARGYVCLVVAGLVFSMVMPQPQSTLEVYEIR